MKKVIPIVVCFLSIINAQLPGPAEIFRQPAFYGNSPVEITWSPGDSVVAFIWNKAGFPDGDIWLAKIPSGKLRQLTHLNETSPGSAITNLQWFPDQQRLLFTRNGDIYTIRPGQKDDPVALTVTPGEELAPSISPKGRYVSFIRDNTLRLIDIRESREIQLADMPGADWSGISRYCRTNRYAPYRWAPDESAIIIPAYNGDFTRELLYIDIANQETYILPVSRDEHLLVRDIAWIPDTDQLAIDYLTESLHTRQIILVSPKSQAIDTVYIHNEELWCSNFGSKLYWLANEQKLLFGDLQNGYQHIFTVGLDNKIAISITRGKWNVFDYAVHPGSDRIYFSANKENHYEKHIYTIDQKSGKVLNLSYLHGSHDFTLSATGNYIVDIFSTPSVPPQLYLTRTFPVSKAQTLLVPDARIPDAVRQTNALDLQVVRPDGNGDGDLVYYRLLLPADHTGAGQYPLIVFLNKSTGPMEGLHEWDLSRLLCQWLSNQGYAVAVIDYPNPGQLSSRPQQSGPDNITWNNALQDINVVLDELSRNEFIDMSRVGVTGFGYNGYLGILATLNNPDRFSASVAIPLENKWSAACDLYEKTVYEEIAKRGLAPDLTSPETISQLRGKFLIIYSQNDQLLPLIDSQAMIHKMVNSQKRIDFIHYPWEDTIIESDQTYIDLFYKLLEYFDRFL